MTALGSHPVITIVILFVVFFTVFFLLIYGTLRFSEGRRSRKGAVSAQEIAAWSQVPTYVQFKTCPKCGTTMPGVASFCPECGAAQIHA